MKFIVFSFLLLFSGFVLAKVEVYLVTVSELNVRLAPNLAAKISHVMKQGEIVGVFEVKDGWARISEYYPAKFESGEGGKISDGDVARWVFHEYISPQNMRTITPSPTSQLEKAIEYSDDFSIHRVIFIKMANGLINSGRCTLQDFVRNGGWYRSVTHKPRQIYFTYCGKTHISNRIYLDPEHSKLID